MKLDFTEDISVEQPTIKFFLESLDYNDYNNHFDEKFGDNEERKNSGEVILRKRLRTALQDLNKDLPTEAIDKAIEILKEDRYTQTICNANKEIYELFKEGIKVKIKDENNEDQIETVKVFDFNNAKNNDFYLASQFWITGEVYKVRPDLIVFVNGLPLVLIELKASHKNLRNAYELNIQPYKEKVPQLFWYNAFIILSNGLDSKVGTITSSYKFFREWKKISSEEEQGRISLETILKGTCCKEYLIDLFENFVLYKQEEGDSIKILAQNHQFLGVNNAIKGFKDRKKNKGRLGVFWHTPGSGKSFSMVFFSQKVLRKEKGNFTFLILTDREELDKQIHQTFQDVGVVNEDNVRATSGSHLKQLLTENHRYLFTLIHKFNTKKGENYPELNKRDDIIVIVDEAHRTQYDKLALNMKNALPNAGFLAFTGTPLIDKEEELTKGTFGDYVSIYNFKQSIDDNATVPVYYENRVPEVELGEKELNKKIYEAIDEVEVDKAQEEKLKKEFSREYHIITRPDRLDKISKDIVSHFIERGYQGKSMVVSIDKLTTVKMYDNVEKHFNEELEKVNKQLARTKDEIEKDDLLRKKSLIEAVEMAVVVSEEQNEINKFKKEGLDIVKHRKKMKDEDLASKFKEEDNNFKMVFVCNMWMTGFDVPTLSTLYLDKPMKNHTLMQTLARINRIANDKQSGLIVDYIGLFKYLQDALSIYALSTDGDDEFPIKPKETLLEILDDRLIEMDNFCKEIKVNPKVLLDLDDKFEQIKIRDDITSIIVEQEKTKNKFLGLTNKLLSIYKAILPDKRATKYVALLTVYASIKQAILGKKEDVDIEEFIPKIQKILDKSILSKDYATEKNKIIDISKLNFEKLKEQFEKGRKGIVLDNLKKAIEDKLEKMVKFNSTRFDFYEKYKDLIESYNAGSKNIEEIFDELMKFVNTLNEEDTRNVKEDLTEEELALFDKIKTEPITKKDKEKVKEVAKSIIQKIKEQKVLSLDWRKKPVEQAKVTLFLKKELNNLPFEPYPNVEIMEEKLQKVYEHLYENYYGEGKSVYI